MVSILFANPFGTYSLMSEVDIWDETRDARLYDGKNPVVAHPPCQRWGRLGYAAWKRWGGDHNRPGNDQGCFAAALAAVRRVGGVLEHPAYSLAFPEFNIKRPQGSDWLQVGINEYVCEILQSQWGHKAQKKTWLFYAGVPPLKLTAPFPNRLQGSHQIGFADQRGKERNKPTLGKLDAIKTPILFAFALVRLAQKSRGVNSGIPNNLGGHNELESSRD
jgi:hypothetical protein